MNYTLSGEYSGIYTRFASAAINSAKSIQQLNQMRSDLDTALALSSDQVDKMFLASQQALIQKRIQDLKLAESKQGSKKRGDTAKNIALYGSAGALALLLVSSL